MKDNKTMWILLALVMVAAVIAVVYGTRQRQQQPAQTGTANAGGWWSGLWSNAANIVDAGGRHTAAATTSLGNAISSVIATSKSDGKAYYSQYGYSNPNVNYGPYVLGAGFVIAAGVLAAIVFTNK